MNVEVMYGLCTIWAFILGFFLRGFISWLSENGRCKENMRLKEDIEIFNDLVDKYNDALKMNEELKKVVNELEEKRILLQDDVNYYQIKSGYCEEELLYLRRENKQLMDFINELTEKGTGKIVLSNGNVYNVKSKFYSLCDD